MMRDYLAAIVLGFPASALAQPPVPLWNISFGAPVDAGVYAAAADSIGGVYVAGSASAGLYGPNSGAFIARFTAAGGLQWGRQFSTEAESKGAESVCTSPTGAVFVAGGVVNRLAPPYDTDAHLARYTSVGDQIWARRLGTPDMDKAGAICADASGGVYVAGYTGGSLAAPHAGSFDIFVAHYSCDGDQLWVRQFGSPQVEYCWAAIPDGAGGVYIAGDTYGVLGAGNYGLYDAWIARYDASGQRLWVRQYGTANGDGIASLCSDGAGGLYAGGWTYGSFGPGSLGAQDAFVMRLTPNGEPIWVRQLGSSGGDEGSSVSLCPDGGVYILGDTSGTVAVPQIGGMDLFLARYSAAGQQLWVHQFGTERQDLAYASAPDATGGVFVGGRRTINANYETMATLARFPGPCYPNCDSSTAAPRLNVADFTCFLQRFAAADAYANCDASTTAPVLNVADFTCFLQQFAAGCP